MITVLLLKSHKQHTPCVGSVHQVNTLKNPKNILFSFSFFGQYEINVLAVTLCTEKGTSIAENVSPPPFGHKGLFTLTNYSTWVPDILWFWLHYNRYILSTFHFVSGIPANLVGHFSLSPLFIFP